jgi:hypothetical protein
MNATTEMPSKSPIVDPLPQKITLDDFLRTEFPAEGNTELDIKHLWEDYYRLNFWGSKKIELCDLESKIIKYSWFVRIKKISSGYEIVEKKKN